MISRLAANRLEISWGLFDVILPDLIMMDYFVKILAFGGGKSLGFGLLRIRNGAFCF